MKNWYKRACLLSKFAKMVRDITVGGDWDDFEENVRNLHELEYKAHRVDMSPHFIHPKRKENISIRIHDKAWEHFEDIKTKLINAFEDWKNRHRIDNAEIWSEMVYNTVAEQNRNEEETNKDILKNGIFWGQQKLAPENISECVDLEQIKAIRREDMEYNLKAYDYQLEQWLDNKNPNWKDKNENAVEYAQENGLDDDFVNESMTNWTEEEAREYARDMGVEASLIDSGAIKRAIAKYLYPVYIDNWGSAVENIIEEINEAVERLNSITEESAISQMTAAVSLALNVMHVGGNIGGDYLGYGKDFLYEMSNVDVTEWEKEVGEEFGL